MGDGGVFQGIWLSVGRGLEVRFRGKRVHGDDSYGLVMRAVLWDFLVVDFEHGRKR